MVTLADLKKPISPKCRVVIKRTGCYHLIMEKKWYTVVWVGGVVGWVYRPLTEKEKLVLTPKQKAIE